MKKVLLLCCLTVCTVQVSSQYLDYSHNLAVWSNVGYSRFSIDAPEASVPGRFGANIGLGYEFHYKRFILQSGVDIQRISSTTTYDNIQQIVPMRDTEGRLFDGIFDFKNNTERQTFNNVAIPLLAGFSFYDMYFLVGGKFQYNFNSNVVTSSNVVSSARYDMIIGSDGDGLIHDMPNHGLTTVRRTIKSNLELSPIYYAISLEIGKKIEPSSFRIGNAQTRSRYSRYTQSRNPRIFGQHYYRIALFCDYGFASLKGKTSQDIIVNTATQQKAYAPTLNHIVYSTKNLQTLYIGVKFTLLFEFIDKYSCQCE
jgi:hypothetical protein